MGKSRSSPLPSFGPLDVDPCVFYFCSMASDADMIEDNSRLLRSLAELSLAMAGDLQAALAKADNVRDVLGLAGAFAKIGRCMRLTVALRARLAEGKTLVAAPRAQAEHNAPLDAELAHESDPSEADPSESERAEGPDRETLYERLPNGDPAEIARGIALELIQVARTLSAPKARGAKPIVLTRDYETLCRDLVANDPQPPDNPPIAFAARGPP